MPDAVVFCGIQGAGKSAFYRRCFFETHVRINLDMLRTRERERLLVEACLRAGQRFVVDNTNPTVAERRRYIEPARDAAFRIVGYFFDVPPRVAIARNAERAEPARVPVPAILGTRKRLQAPTAEEGFDELWRVSIDPEHRFAVERIQRPA